MEIAGLDGGAMRLARLALEAAEKARQPQRYSLAEIDEMRFAVAWMLNHRTMLMDAAASSTIIENHLRTYMLAGIAPEELIEAGKNVETEVMGRGWPKT